VPQPRVQDVEKLGRALDDTSSAANVTAYQSAQRALWQEQQLVGNPWLVTDFVTLGSPLAHAELLLAESKRDLRTRQDQLELPTCPPNAERRRRKSTVGRYHYVVDYKIGSEPRSVRVLHHAAPFAVTRWSNIYVPLRLGLLGDLVGGPLRPVFGPGVRDVAADAGPLQFTPFLTHTRYWKGSAATKPAGRTTALRALCTALDLESKR